MTVARRREPSGLGRLLRLGSALGAELGVRRLQLLQNGRRGRLGADRVADGARADVVLHPGLRGIVAAGPRVDRAPGRGPLDAGSIELGLGRVQGELDDRELVTM